MLNQSNYWTATAELKVYIRVYMFFLQEQFHFIVCMLKVLNFAISSFFTLGFSVIRNNILLTQRCTQFCSISQVICITCNKTLEYLAMNMIVGSLYLRDLCFVWLIWSTCHSSLESALVCWSFWIRIWEGFSQQYQDRLSVSVLIERCQNLKKCSYISELVQKSYLSCFPCYTFPLL